MPRYPVAENIKAGTYEGITTFSRTEVESLIERDDWQDMSGPERYSAVRGIVEEHTTDNRMSIMRMIKSVMTEKDMLEEPVEVGDLEWDRESDTITAIEVLRQVLIIQATHDVVMEVFKR